MHLYLKLLTEIYQKNYIYSSVSKFGKVLFENNGPEGQWIDGGTAHQRGYHGERGCNGVSRYMKVTIVRKDIQNILF